MKPIYVTGGIFATNASTRPKTAVLASGCKVHETDFGLQIELSELGVMRSTQQFREIRAQLRNALMERYGRTTVK